MPGLLLHLCFGKMIYEKANEKLKLDKADFLSGCLIPDMTTDKRKSHYRVPASVGGYFVPQMDTVKKELLDLNNSVKLGIYAHLYLDYHFFENFIFKNYIWENGIVINPRNNLKWTYEDFFDRSGIYHSYGELNSLLFNKGDITPNDVSIIPEILPLTNIEIFDNRREKAWLQEFNGYLEEKCEYTGNLLDYEDTIRFIRQLVPKFIKDINYSF